MRASRSSRHHLPHSTEPASPERSVTSQRQIELGILDYTPEAAAAVGTANLLAPVGLRIVSLQHETCVVRFVVPCPRGKTEELYWDTITHCQVKVNGSVPIWGFCFGFGAQDGMVSVDIVVWMTEWWSGIETGSRTC